MPQSDSVKKLKELIMAKLDEVTTPEELAEQFLCLDDDEMA